MNALDNASIADKERKGLASFAFPVARSSRNGESVSYVPSAGRQWYVLRIKFGQARRVADFLIEKGTYAYLAMVWRDIRHEGKRRRVKVPFMNILFAYATAAEAEKYVRDYAESRYITYYYNHFATNQFGLNPPLTVRDDDLQSLVLATSINDEHVMEVSLRDCRFEADELVRVTEGPFQGICGRVARIARQKRVVVYIRGLDCGITTAYVPAYCLEKIEDM